VDEIIVTGTRGPAAPGLRDPRSVLAGADLATGEFFPMERWDTIRQRFGNDSDILAFEPAVQSQATAVNAASGLSHAGVNIMGLRPGAVVFDTYRDTDGVLVSLAGLGPGEIFVNTEAARLLAITPGHELSLNLADDRTAAWVVRGVVRDNGVAGIQPAIIAPLGLVQEAVAKPGEINQILVTNRQPPVPCAISGGRRLPRRSEARPSPAVCGWRLPIRRSWSGPRAPSPPTRAKARSGRWSSASGPRRALPSPGCVRCPRTVRSRRSWPTT
jgi:hypothetical protein